MIIVYIKTCSPNPLILLLADRIGLLRTGEWPQRSSLFCLPEGNNKHQTHDENEKYSNLQLLVLASEWQRNPETAAQLCDLAVSLQGALENILPQVVIPAHDERVDISRKGLGENSSKNEMIEAETMAAEGLPNVIVHALAQPSSGLLITYPETEINRLLLRSRREAAKQKYGGLTARERQVAGQIAQGKSNQEIAAELFVGLKTVETHVTHILSKLGFASRAQVAAWAVAKGLADPPADLVTLIRKDVESL